MNNKPPKTEELFQLCNRVSKCNQLSGMLLQRILIYAVGGCKFTGRTAAKNPFIKISL